jgi:predicted DNA-binding transcriptional regulator YafY
VPERLRPFIADPSIGTPPRSKAAPDAIDLGIARSWIREGRKIRIDYRDERGAVSDRVIWPVIIGFFDQARVIAAWCELRQDFRHFRTDRIVAAQFLDEHYPARPGELRSRWKRGLAQRHQP